MIVACTSGAPQAEDTGNDELLVKTLVKAARDGQSGIAELYADAFRDQYIFDHTGAQWNEFSGHSWQPILTGDEVAAVKLIRDDYLKKAVFLIKKKRKQTIADHVGPDDKAYETAIKSFDADEKALNSAIQNLGSLHYMKAVCDLAARSADGLSVITEQFDKEPWLLACKNGVIDLQTGNLRDGRPSDYLRRTVPTPYHPDAACPRFEKFLDEVFDGDVETVSFVQRLLGMSLIGDGDIKQNIFIFCGRGRNGKNTLLDTIAETLGSQVCSKVASELLLSQQHGKGAGAASPEIVGLQGLRLIYASETNEGRSFDVSKVKELSGGGFLRGRGVYAKHEITFKSSHMVILDTNSMPHADAGDYAFFQRLRCVNFPLSYVDEPEETFERKKDPYLKAALTQESSGILAWLIHGCIEYQKHGLKEPAAVKAAVLAYRDSEDIIMQFLDERCNTSAHARSTGAKDLYDAYRIWCIESGVKSASMQKFGRYMTARYRNSHTMYGKVYEGVDLR